MALPDKHQLKFNSHKDAKTLMEAIEKRNKADLEEQSLDDLFNSLKIYEAEVKHSSSTGTTTQNLAFVSSSNTDSTAESVSATASVFAVCAKMHVSSLPNVDSLSRNLGANGPTSMGFDISKVECYNFHRKGHFARECRSPKDSRRNGAAEPQRRTVPVETSTSNALVSQCDGVGSYNWSFQAEEEPANYALMAFSSLSSSSDNEVPSCSKACSKAYAQLHSQYDKLTADFCKSQFDDISYQTESDESWPPSSLYDRFQPSDGYHVVPPPYTGTFMPPKPDLVFNTAPTAVETDHPAFNVQLSPTKPEQDLSHIIRPIAPIIEDWVSDSEDESETKAPQIVLSFVQSTEQVKSPRHSVQHVETSILVDTPKPVCLKPTSPSKRRNRKACFVCKSLDHLIKDCEYHAKKMAQPITRNHAHRVLTQSKPVSITAVRPVSTAVPQIKVTQPKQVQPIVTKPKSPIRRYITRSPSPKTSNLPPRVTDVKAPVGSPQHALKDKGVIDSGCSRHMTGNMSYVSDFEELNGGYVSFGGNPNGGKIFGKGKIRTGKLDFDDVYFIKELKFNLFSVSRMCDKKNSVLFTDTECFVLSPDFKLPDASQVLLRVLRETICNLVRGLPTKVFKNDNTCAACKKGKQHRASCKTKHASSVDQPLYRLHMDLFGPTFVKSLNKKSYYLVVTDDYSRFTWVFFLATKDETSPILKTFITGLENQLSLKVKVIRSDNGTELKNNDLNQFCGIKGIKKEFSVPRTPQQNGIAERKSRTLIEAARTMLADSLLPIPFWAEAVNTACYVQNRVLVTKPHNKTPYELLHGRTPSSGPTWLFVIDSLTRTMNYQPVTTGNQTNPSVGFQDKFAAEKAGEEIDQQYVLFPVWSFGSINPQNNDGDAAFDGKESDFDAKKPESEVNVSPCSSAQSRKQDDKTKKKAKGKSPVDTIVPTVGQNSPNNTNTFSAAGPLNAAASPTHGKSSFIDASKILDDHDMPELEDITYSDDEDDVGAEADINNLETSITVSPIPTSRIHKDHLVTQIIDDLSSITQTRSMTKVVKDQEEPKRVHQALKDLSWIEAMQEELIQFKMQKVWVLVDLPYGKRAIGTKWVFRNKKDERGIVIRNKARLVAQGHTEEEGIDSKEVFAPVARIEDIRLFLAYASFMGFMVYQMDVKSVFLYRTIEEEVYICQPLGFEDPDHPDKVYKVVKAL
nr:hypothetical protein [Tanacetum cinerariifolium]